MDWIDKVVRSVAELPDRNSPEGWPEAMLVTAGELRDILIAATTDLASKCQGVARCISYNASAHEAQAKHTLLEASHALDAHSIRVHRKRDGLLMVNARGKSRFMTLRERIAYWLLGNTTDIRP